MIEFLITGIFTILNNRSPNHFLIKPGLTCSAAEAALCNFKAALCCFEVALFSFEAALRKFTNLHSEDSGSCTVQIQEAAQCRFRKLHCADSRSCTVQIQEFAQC